MKTKPELQLRTYADHRELVVQDRPKPHPLVLSALWGGKKSGGSKPPEWTSSTFVADSPVWRDGTTV